MHEQGEQWDKLAGLACEIPRLFLVREQVYGDSSEFRMVLHLVERIDMFSDKTISFICNNADIGQSWTMSEFRFVP